MTVEFSGPLFDGSAKAAMDKGAEEAEQQLAVAVRDAVRDVIRRRARQRSGYYESRVQVDVLGGDRVVDASGVIYDDWLQGTAPRNNRSSFKGYRQWDVARSEVDAQAVAVVDKALAPYIAKMG